jgi:hypothetical protein
MKIPNFIPDGPAMADALRKIVSAIIAGWNVEHRPDGTHNFATTQTTVGSAGSGSALPATPEGYIVIRVGGTEKVIPYYDPS